MLQVAKPLNSTSCGYRASPLWNCTEAVSIPINVCLFSSCSCVTSMLRHSFGDLEPAAAIQHRAERAGQEVRCRNKIKHLVDFQNKKSMMFLS